MLVAMTKMNAVVDLTDFISDLERRERLCIYC